MDDKILKYLDQVGQYVQGASEKGFETYVHGVFIESIVTGMSGLLVTIICLSIIVWLLKGYRTAKDNDIGNGFRDGFMNEMSIPTLIGIIVFSSLGVLGIIIFCTNITGIIAPDYVAIKQIVEGITSK